MKYYRKIKVTPSVRDKFKLLHYDSVALFKDRKEIKLPT